MHATKPDQPLTRFVVLAALGAVAVVGLLTLFATNPSRAVEHRPADTPAMNAAAAPLVLVVGVVTVAGVGVAGYLSHKRRSAVEAEVLGTLPADTCREVHTVLIAGRRVLVGVDESGVNSVAELPSAEPRAVVATLPNDVSVLFARLRIT